KQRGGEFSHNAKLQFSRVPGELMETLTSGQRAATRMILETSDRFTVVQGYAGVGKTTQFRAVMSAVN
ncbi:AAA family ATPase, partial [Escherichia coli]